MKKAFFRLPNQENLSTVRPGESSVPLLFRSFTGNEVLPFEGKVVPITVDELPELRSTDLTSKLNAFQEENARDYTEKIARVIDFVKDNNLPKLVISRQKRLELSAISAHGINLTESFKKLCAAYPSAFAYLLVAENQCWMGAFSEVLGHYDRQTGIFRTMSLAGTVPASENWSEKELTEQKAVSTFVRAVLSDFNPEVYESELQDHPSGNIRHLRTDFSIALNEDQLGALVSRLHPTPAVCGIPRDICMPAIARFEAHDRRLYAGYIRVETGHDIFYFVNLRCAQFFRNAVLAYAGGGITALSDPSKEFRETELKMEAVLKNLI